MGISEVVVVSLWGGFSSSTMGLGGRIARRGTRSTFREPRLSCDRPHGNVAVSDDDDDDDGHDDDA